MKSNMLQDWFPWTRSPVVGNAPMMGTVTPQLAAEVTRAGGLGFIGSIADLTPNSAHLAKLQADLDQVRQYLGDQDSSGIVRVGVSFITGHSSVTHFHETALPILKEKRPAAVWLFAPDGEVKPHGAIITAIKGLETPPKVFVQVGNVAAAREAIQDGADVVVCQGVDAGGHQFRRGTGVITLVPEVRNMLQDEFQGREIGLLAAGGISDGRGTAAALALGADGVIMGTRFVVADESQYSEHGKELVLKSVDGGVSTLKSPFNDQINNSTLWGPLYDGRAIIGTVHEKFLQGATLEECHQFLKDGYSEEESSKMIKVWAGAGVGLVKRRQPAGEIVKEVQKEVDQVLRGLAGRL